MYLFEKSIFFYVIFLFIVFVIFTRYSYLFESVETKYLFCISEKFYCNKNITNVQTLQRLIYLGKYLKNNIPIH